MTQKLYCYVDESGQDTRGRLFVVSVVVTAEERDDLTRMLEQIERETGKGRLKWYKTSYPRRKAYIQRILELESLREKLSFAVYHDTVDYLDLTAKTVVNAVKGMAFTGSKVTVFIDALPSPQAHLVSRALRKARVRFNKVRGVKNEESSALIRLADALCGFVRAVYENQPEMAQLFERATRAKTVRDVSP